MSDVTQLLQALDAGDPTAADQLLPLVSEELRTLAAVRMAQEKAGLTVLPDTDGDGLPDEWESAHGLDPTSPADALLDGDGDGLNALVEYQAGTVPTNASSVLRTETVSHANGRAALGFNAAANRTYTVEWTSAVGGGSWQKLADVVAQGVDRLETVTDPDPGEGARFYRVVTPRRP